jgi:hypothetical protein
MVNTIRQIKAQNRPQYNAKASGKNHTSCIAWYTHIIKTTNVTHKYVYINKKKNSEDVDVVVEKSVVSLKMSKVEIRFSDVTLSWEY